MIDIGSIIGHDPLPIGGEVSLNTVTIVGGVTKEKEIPRGGLALVFPNKKRFHNCEKAGFKGVQCGDHTKSRWGMIPRRVKKLRARCN